MFPSDEVYLKTENLQVTGSFKLRGAYYKMTRLTEEQKRKGVVACSAGNHAQGVALAASRLGIDAVICIPEGAPISKVEATRSLGATVELVRGVYDDAYVRAHQICEETGKTLIHPFDDEDVIAGQGTLGLEILEQLPELDAVIVPVGGGGLIAGVAYVLKKLRPSVKVYGVQAAGAASMVESLAHHKIETLSSVSTVSDGIAVKSPGELTYSCTEKYVDKVVTVTDDEVACAILDLMEKQKLVAEGAGAVAVAAAMFNKVDIKGKKTVCLVSGGNIDVTILSRVINRALLREGRYADFTIALQDKPGQLADISAIIARLGANVVGVFHERAGSDTDLNACTLRLTIETRNQEHVDEIKAAITNEGYEIVAELE